MRSDQTATPPSVRRWLARAAKLAVTLVAAYLALRRIDGAELWRALRAVVLGPALTAFGLYLAGQLLSAWRWHLIARAVGLAQGFGRSAVFYFVGMFFNHVGPSTLGGDLVRALYLGAGQGRRPTAMATVALDRLLGLVALLLIASAAVMLSARVALPRVLTVVTVVVTCALVLGWLLVGALASRGLAADSRLAAFARSEIAVVARDPAMLGRLTAISMVFHAIQIVAAMAVGRAVGLEVASSYYLVFHPLVAVMAALPVSIAGLGVRELGYVYFLANLAAVPHHTALAFAMVWLVLVLAASAVGGMVFWLSGIGLPAVSGAPPSSAAATHPSSESSQFPSSS